MDCYNQTYRTARKVHYCEFCGKQIEKGEKYSYESWKDGGDFCQSKLCVTCRNMIEKFVTEEKPDEYTLGYVAAWLYEEHCYSCKHFKKCERSYSDIQNCEIIRKDFEKEKQD